MAPKTVQTIKVTVLAIAFVCFAVSCNHVKVPKRLDSPEKSDTTPAQAPETYHYAKPQLSDVMQGPEWYAADDEQKRHLYSRAIADRLNGHAAHVTSVSTLLIIGSPEFDEYAAHKMIDDLHGSALLAGYSEIDIQRLRPVGTVCKNEYQIIEECRPLFTWKHRLSESQIPSLR